MKTIPGIHIAVPARAGSTTVAERAESGRHQAGWSLGDWLTARIVTRRPLDESVARDPCGVTVALEGYLTGIVGPACAAVPAAADLLRLYLAEGTACLARLRGSYTGVILDPRAQQAHLFNDRRATRPLFVRRDDSGLYAGPEVAALARLVPALVEIDPVAVSQFVIFASYYGDRTLFPAIRRLPPASLLTLEPGGRVAATRYWQLSIEPDRRAGNEDEWLDQILAQLEVSCRNLGPIFSRPVLLLSGGGDSRAIAACLRRAGQRVDALSYGTKDGDDALVARQVAQTCGMPFTYWPLRTDQLEARFVDAARQSDSQAETIDAPMLGSLYEQIAATHDVFVQGDKSVYGRIPATADEAFEAAGIHGWRSARRFVDMLTPAVARTVCGELNTKFERMRGEGRHLAPVDLRDKLFFEHGQCNLQNGFTAMKLRHMEQFQPWLDEDLVDLMVRLPTSVRGEEKALVRRVTARAAPDLAALPYARKDSIPQSHTYKAALAQHAKLAQFIRGQFAEMFDDRLASLLRPGAVQALTESFVTGAAYPWPRRPWWLSLPGLWRLEARRYAADKVHPVRIVMRLLQLNLFLASLR